MVALKEEKEFAISGKQKVSVREETNAVSAKLARTLANLLLVPTRTARMQRTCCDVGMHGRAFSAQSPSCGIRAAFPRRVETLR